ncbi:hypothetical protein JCM9279_002505 [Rhodotorula babjevae]
MLRPKRAAASKARDCLKDALSGEDEEQAPLVVNDSTRRLSGRRQSRSADSDDDATWSQDPDSDADSRPAKKPRTSSSSSRAKRKHDDGTSTTQVANKRKKGKLSTFLAMPLDILVEIAQHLDPPTLLAMTRTNKLMHNLLASRSARPIWAAVRRNVDLPELEATDLNEMQLVSLIHDRNCHLCGRGRAVIVDYAVRARWCKSCQNANLLTEVELQQPGCVKDLHALALDCALSFFHDGNSTIYYRLQDVQSVSNRLNELDAKGAPAPTPAAATRRSTARRDRQDRQNETEAALDPAAGPVLEAERELEVFIHGRRTEAEAARKDVVALLEWERSSTLARKEAVEAACRRRRHEIEQRLFALGYLASDCKFSLDLDRLVDRPTALTNVVWNRISAQLIECAQRHKVVRLAHERVKLMHDRRKLLLGRYNALLAALDGERSLKFPSFMVFVGAARRAIQVGFARAAVTKLVDPRELAVVKTVTEKLESVPQATGRTGALLRSTMASTDVADLKVAFDNDLLACLDLSDTAATVTDRELDDLFGQPFATFFLGADRPNGASASYRYPEILVKLRELGRPGLATPWTIHETHNSDFGRYQGALLARAGWASVDPNGRSFTPQGHIFPCVRCLAASRAKIKSRTWRGAMDHYNAVHT